MEVFFAEPDQISENRIRLDEFESKHILHTLKKKIGDKITITDGQGNLYHAEIIETAKRIGLAYHNYEKFKKTVPEITLAVGFIRPNRLDMLFEKCTELGVNRFILFRSQFTNYVSFNLSRFYKILRQAVKQSLQYYLPELKVIEKFDEFIDQSANYDARLICRSPDDPGIITTLKDSEAGKLKSVILGIGPEGGFSPGEFEKFKKNNFTFVSLGKTRLRTETAAITGVSVLQSYLQYHKESNIGNR
ncbi:MAG: 16S rRNA (uracil(1498)-N(3))-methyltransferase [Calditrichaceae bacterium]|nr:16S rRNA (uracil(1498)-N(3))-methyltransferase [Calditrichaceae bacterium]HES59554.1 16S rRNA (uracil(1498)-N(3))-methyltransferase [Caldithrix sp.]